LVRVVAETGRGGVGCVGIGLVARRHAARNGGSAPSRLAIVTAVWGSYAASLAVARVIDRDRPCHGSGDDDCPDGPSFPSDQASAAFAATLVVADLSPELRIPVLAAAALNSLARVWLGFHHVSDVAGGAVLGAVVARFVLARSA
jgi:membrane-associated phospholipid phosphatase